MAQALVAAAPPLIGGRFSVDFGRSLPLAAPGQAAYAVQDRGGRPGLMAVQARPGLPPRARMLAALAPAPVQGVLCPLAHGPAALPSGEEAYFVVTEAPLGRPLHAVRAWAEHDLIEHVLRPIAGALERLAAAGATHRAINAHNVFQGAPGEAVVLGAAWAQPAAFAQPAIYEPPYVAACDPAGRGDGSIADDVYALGVLLVVLALGADPAEGLAPEAVIQRKLDIGSFAAIAGDRRLPSSIAELARGMLADDPDHRPTPTLLANPTAARARRIAARPPRRAQRPLEFEGLTIWNTRVLAHALGRHPQPGAALVRSGAVGQWLRRSIGDGPLATRLDEMERIRAGASGSDHREDALLLTRTIAVLDPLAPMHWPGVTAWPDGMGELLIQMPQPDQGDQAAAIDQAMKADAVSAWAAIRGERCNAPSIRTEARRWMTVLTAPNAAFARLRLAYALNPLHPCASPLLAGRIVTRTAELLPALEAAAHKPRSGGPVDPHIAAFLAGRRDDRACSEIPDPSGLPVIQADPVAQLRLLARLQASLHPTPLPGLAAWLVDTNMPALERFHSQSRRKRLEVQFREQAQTGNLATMLRSLDDPAERQNDHAGWTSAQARIAQIDDALAELIDGRPTRHAALRGVTADVGGGAGLLAASASVVIGLLPG